jgi:hypothetical protein
MKERFDDIDRTIYGAVFTGVDIHVHITRAERVRVDQERYAEVGVLSVIACNPP